MKRYVPLLVMLALCGLETAVLAATLDNRGPEVMNFKMGTMVTPFQHWKHQKLAKDDCLHCHDRRGEKIKGWGEESAHKICIPCHDLDDKGPVKCHECHDKKLYAPKR